MKGELGVGGLIADERESVSRSKGLVLLVGLDWVAHRQHDNDGRQEALPEHGLVVYLLIRLRLLLQNGEGLKVPERKMCGVIICLSCGKGVQWVCGTFSA